MHVKSSEPAFCPIHAVGIRDEAEAPLIVTLLQLLAWTVFMAVLILWPAGTLFYPAGWALIGLFAVGGLAMVIWLSKHSPSLLRERMASPLQRSQKPWDRVWLGFFIVAFCGWIAFMGWDAARADFSAMPSWLQAIGALGVVLDGAATWWTFRENTFAAPVVKLQANQRVIDSGPYAIVRHPMYTGTLFLFVGIPLLLGSWRGLALSIGFVLAIAWRAVQEERVLCRELDGYEDYVRRVRYRFVPQVW